MANANGNQRVLPNIRKLVTWDHGQNYMFNGCMDFLMECLGEKGYDYWYIAGVTGDGFTQVYGTDYGRYHHSLSQSVFDRDFARTAFDACGYGFDYADAADFAADREGWIGRIVSTIDAGLPVIAQGFCPPAVPTAEFSLICGYSDDGRELLLLDGDNTEPTPADPYALTPMALVFAGGRQRTPDPAEEHRKAILGIPHLLTMPERDGVLFGKEAFNAWADGFVNGRFDGVSPETFDAWRDHTTYMCIMATNSSCRGFLRRAFELNPDMGIIKGIDEAFAGMKRVWDDLEAMGGGFGITIDTLRDAEKCRAISAKIRELVDTCDDVLRLFD